MKRPRGILLILLISACLFLCMTWDGFALFRDDVSVEEAAEWVNSERERSRIELKKRQKETEEEILTLEITKEEVVIPEEKEVSPSVSLAKRVPFGLIRKIVAALVALIIVGAVIFGNKHRFTNRPHND